MAGITAGIDLGPGMITLNANAICDINKITMQKAGDPSELRRFGITVFAGYELRF